MNKYLKAIKPYQSYKSYYDYIKLHLEKVNKLSEIINSIPLSSLNPQKFASMRKIRKEFYLRDFIPFSKSFSDIK